MQKKLQENALNKVSDKTKWSNTSIPPPSDSEGWQKGVQSREISSDDCAICHSLYKDDMYSMGKLLTGWVNCANPKCRKWMHAQCLELKDGLYSCGLC